MKGWFKEVKAKARTLVFRYGKCEGEEDLVSSNGDECPHADCCLVLDFFTSQRLRRKFPTLQTEFHESFVEELKQRGYDTKTIKFSVELKKSEVQP